MPEYFVNVSVCYPDNQGDFDIQSSVVYHFDNWEEATKFIKLSLDNELLVQVRLPKD